MAPWCELEADVCNGDDEELSPEQAAECKALRLESAPAPDWRVHRACSVPLCTSAELESTSHLQCPTLRQCKGMGISRRRHSTLLQHLWMSASSQPRPTRDLRLWTSTSRQRQRLPTLRQRLLSCTLRLLQQRPALHQRLLLCTLRQLQQRPTLHRC